MLTEEKVIMNRDMEKMHTGGCGLGFCQYSPHPYFMMNNIVGFITRILKIFQKDFTNYKCYIAKVNLIPNKMYLEGIYTE
jgi:hypothetical protein